MAWSDTLTNQDLLRYLSDVHDLFMYYLEIHKPDAIEGFLDEYQYEFAEWKESEGIGDGND